MYSMSIKFVTFNYIYLTINWLNIITSLPTRNTKFFIGKNTKVLPIKHFVFRVGSDVIIFSYNLIMNDMLKT